MLYNVLIVLYVIQDLAASPQSALSRDSENLVTYGNFKLDPFHYLFATKIAASFVNNESSCLFVCLNEQKCYSANIAAYLNDKDLYLCELLVVDKYRAKEKFQENANFHHYSPWVSLVEIDTVSDIIRVPTSK